MAPERSQVRNAADPQQVRRAGRVDRDKELIVLANLRAVMSEASGRAAMWDLISRAGVYGSIWHPSAQIHYNAGRQDYGHELMALLLQADEQLYMLMEQEARARQRADDRSTEAAHTPRTEEQTHG